MIQATENSAPFQSNWFCSELSNSNSGFDNLEQNTRKIFFSFIKKMTSSFQRKNIFVSDIISLKSVNLEIAQKQQAYLQLQDAIEKAKKRYIKKSSIKIDEDDIKKLYCLIPLCEYAKPSISFFAEKIKAKFVIDKATYIIDFARGEIDSTILVGYYVNNNYKLKEYNQNNFYTFINNICIL